MPTMPVWYITASTSSAAAVVLNAFYQRPNFYSATVYLSQSNACVLVLSNFALLCAIAFFIGLQRLLYGRLRPVEVEQLYEKAWAAVTETLLAMTVFSHEIGGWFMTMFICLVAGRVWEWIARGRVELLEQQPPANPRVFHTRLMLSLFMSLVFDTVVLRYCIETVLEQARPGMIIMFAFEFALLSLASMATSLRYAISVREIFVNKAQTKAKLQSLKTEIRKARREAQRRVDSGEVDADTAFADIQNEDDVDENDIDVPGWEEKGKWVFYLDIASDFLKLVLYIGFFLVIMAFFGFPFHVIHKLFMTLRSFVKRVNDFFKYRNATRDMNSRYPDATAEELGGENTCIICREEMRPWDPQQQNNGQPIDERKRPKKLPCGHVLHFNCLRSWLERQQACPTCRTSVLAPQPTRNTTPNQPNAPNGAPIPGGAQPGHDHNRGPNAGNNNNRRNGGNQPGLRIRNFGPFRIMWGAGPERQVEDVMRQFRGERGRSRRHWTHRDALVPDDQSAGSGTGFGLGDSASVGARIEELERHIDAEIFNLNVRREQLVVLRALQEEFQRLQQPADVSAQLPAGVQMGQAGLEQLPIAPFPDGLVLPTGWTLTPLHQVGPGQLAGGDPLNTGLVTGANLNFSTPVREQPAPQSLPPRPLSAASSVPTPTVSPILSPSSPVRDQPATELQTQEQTQEPVSRGRVLQLDNSAAPIVLPNVAPTWGFDNAETRTEPSSAGAGGDADIEADAGDDAATKVDKGKGKAVPQPTVESEDEESGED